MILVFVLGLEPLQLPHHNYSYMCNINSQAWLHPLAFNLASYPVREKVQKIKHTPTGIFKFSKRVQV